MEYKVFYRKYRPDSFKNIIGQDYSKKMLQNAIKSGKISHAYIFTGPRGTGKTSTAKVFAKSINCEHPIDGEACGECNSCKNFLSSADIIEIDAASNNGVDEVRELINNVKIAPTSSKYKIYIIDEVHMMTQSAFNALLLTLEEPPAHVIFIMATTNIESVPITILSRCQRFDFKKFTLDELISQINYVCEQENIKISLEAAEEIAYISEGGMRDALSLLDQLSSSAKEITIENILSSYGSISSIFIKKLFQNILDNKVEEILKQFEELKNSSSDYKIFIKKFIQELVQYAITLKTEYKSSSLSYEQIKSLVFALNECMNRVNININPYTLIELEVLNYVENSVDELTHAKLNQIKTTDPIQEVIVEHQTDVLENHDEPIKEVSEDNLSTYMNNLKQVRVNNCFYGAQKNYLTELKNLWQEISISPIPDDIINLLVDSNIVAASDTNVIISTNLESTAILINKRIQEIGEYLCEFFNQELSFIALSEEEWQKEKQEYVNKIKSGFKYQMLDEPDIVEQTSDLNQDTSMEKVAQELFDHDKIEII